MDGLDFDQGFIDELLLCQDYLQPLVEHSAPGSHLSKDELETWLSGNVVETWLEASKLFSAAGASTTFCLGGRQYHLCAISQTLVNQVQPFVLHGVIEATRQLPTAIQESADCQPLPEYTVVFHPSAKLARVVVSISPPQKTILSHLTNTLQLFHMGLTGDPGSRGQIFDSFRSTKAELYQVQGQMVTHNINLEALNELKRVIPTLETQRDSKTAFYRLVCGQDIVKKTDIIKTLENKEHDYRQQIQSTKSKTHCLKQSLCVMFPDHTKILGVPTSPGFSSWSDLGRQDKFLPSSISASSDSHRITEKVGSFLHGPWTRRQLAHSQKSGSICHVTPGNVHLDFSNDRAPDATTLHLSSPTLLRARYNNWISPTAPRSALGCILSSSSSSSSWNERNLNVELFLADDFSFTRAITDPIMHLPRVLAWSNDSGADRINQEFIVSEPVFNVTSGISSRERVAALWPRLEDAHQKHLMDLFARLIVAVWNNFDVLDDYIDGQCILDSNAKDSIVQKAPRAPAPVDILAQLETRFMNQCYGDLVTTRGDTMGDLAYPAHPGRDEEVPSFTVAGILLEQRMTTTHAAAIESLARKDVAVQIQEGVTSERMRQFDFSLDDVLVLQPLVTNLDVFGVGSDRPEVAGVAQWKIFDPTSTCLSSLIPGSVNPLQVKARLSSYPLVHMFTPPDFLCIDSDRENWQNLAQQVAQHSTIAAEFMMDPQSTKERKLYHRWMAAWHARSSHSPAETLSRFELLQQSRNRETRASQLRKNFLRQRLAELGKSVASTSDDDPNDASQFLNQMLDHIEITKQRRVRKEESRPRSSHPARNDWSFGLTLWADPDEEEIEDEGNRGKGPSTGFAIDELQGMPVSQLAELENAIRANQLSEEEQAIVERHFSQARIPSDSNTALLQLLRQL
ncbi:hypothetical protein BGZ82_004271 [Podila clonocystis]|nr:hypothetical protein BGZ82_004271 [Podila clonocystis]